MRKRTVITTEKREVWIITQLNGDSEGSDPLSQEDKSPDSRAALSVHYPGKDIARSDDRRRDEKGKKT